MIPEVLLISILFIGFLLWLLALYAITRARRANRHGQLLTKKFQLSAERFAKARQVSSYQITTLQKQLEKAEMAWGDAQAELQYKDTIISSLCLHYKKIKTELQDLTVKYNHLVNQHNSLMSKLPTDGHMPT